MSRLFRMADEIFEDPGELFRDTGCAHCCSLYLHGQIACRFEDVGRHNALDKAVGWALKKGLPLEETVVFTSGRISGDYLAKIIRAGISTVVSRAAVTGEAVKLAKNHGVAMYGLCGKETATAIPFWEKYDKKLTKNIVRETRKCYNLNNR